jgi:hypothetical protein
VLCAALRPATMVYIMAMSWLQELFPWKDQLVPPLLSILLPFRLVWPSFYNGKGSPLAPVPCVAAMCCKDVTWLCRVTILASNLRGAELSSWKGSRPIDLGFF